MAYVFVPGDPGKAVPDSWLGLAITGVANAVCPGTRGPGMTLTVPEASAETGVELGTPVRIAEVMELRLYQSDGQSWLGARSVSAGEPIQPVVGPLAEAAGFRLEYLTGAGTPTTDPTSVKSVKVTLRGQVKGHLEEELITQVTLRNSFRQ